MHVCSEMRASKEVSQSVVAEASSNESPQTTVVSDPCQVHETPALATIQETAAGLRVLSFQMESLF